MRWIKFKDQIPKKTILYITDWTSVWTADCFASARVDDKWDLFAMDNPEYGWADIPIPNTPKDPGMHICGDSKDSKGFCTETVDRKLLFMWRSYSNYINFCPFCGYEAVRKEQTAKTMVFVKDN